MPVYPKISRGEGVHVPSVLIFSVGMARRLTRPALPGYLITENPMKKIMLTAVLFFLFPVLVSAAGDILVADGNGGFSSSKDGTQYVSDGATGLKGSNGQHLSKDGAGYVRDSDGVFYRKGDDGNLHENDDYEYKEMGH